MSICGDSRCSTGVCMGHCKGIYEQQMGNQYLILKSAGFDEARIRFLEKENKYLTKMMWFAWIGWGVTALMFMYFMGN